MYSKLENLPSELLSLIVNEVSCLEDMCDALADQTRSPIGPILQGKVNSRPSARSQNASTRLPYQHFMRRLSFNPMIAGSEIPTQS